MTTDFKFRKSVGIFNNFFIKYDKIVPVLLKVLFHFIVNLHYNKKDNKDKSNFFVLYNIESQDNTNTAK